MAGKMKQTGDAGTSDDASVAAGAAESEDADGAAGSGGANAPDVSVGEAGGVGTSELSVADLAADQIHRNEAIVGVEVALSGVAIVIGLTVDVQHA